MAQNPTQFNLRKIREKFQELNPTNDPHKTVWLMSIENELEESRGGIMTAAHVGHTQSVNRPIEPNVFTAARCIVEKTHRLATDEEIAAYLEDQDKRRAQNKKDELEKKMHISPQMSFPPELIAAFMSWQANQQAARINIEAQAAPAPAKKSKSK